MNNNQFRRLVLDTPSRQNEGSPSGKAASTTLGSKRSSLMPMTPRTVKSGGGVNFARQVAEANAADRPSKKFKSHGPKGVKLAAGYTDRALERLSAEEDGQKDDREDRIKALEEQAKLGQISWEVFVKLRDQMTGGELENTHLVKGLDRQLLDRVRKGEVTAGDANKMENETEEVDDELEELESKEVQRVEKTKFVKKGEMAPPALPVAGQKRARDAILAELKAQRLAAEKERLAARPDLGNMFKSIGPATPAQRTVRDSKGREIITTVDKDGNVKKKVRKISEPQEEAPKAPLRQLDEGSTIPTSRAVTAPAVNEDSDDDIFEGAGTAYNPLDGEEDDSSDEEDPTKAVASVPSLKKGETDGEEGEEGEVLPANLPEKQLDDGPTSNTEAGAPSLPPSPPTSISKQSRNYFKTVPVLPDQNKPPQNPMSDPSFLAAIKKAGSLANVRMQLSGPEEEAGETEDVKIDAEKEARLKKRAAMLASVDRDLDDMDLGFGSSRYADDEDAEEGPKIKLSEWKGAGDADDDDDDKGPKKGKGQKKGSKKRKGDKESAKDVLGVLERRKEGGS